MITTLWQPIFMAGNNEVGPAQSHGFNPATHFGKQVRKERRARGWSIHVLSEKSGINAGHLSRIENGERRPTEHIASRMDAVFPERRGWFMDYYHDSEAWTKPGYRAWAEHERGARQVRAWMPGVLHGLAQTEDYARTFMTTEPGVTAEMIAGQTAARMERQRTVLYRDNPPTVWLLVDELSLYRCVGSPEIMAAQMEHLTGLARLPHVTMQVLPAIQQPGLASELIVADDAAYSEHNAGGIMHTDDETVSSLAVLFNTMQAECLRASESTRLFGRMREAWARGERVLTPPAAEDPASK